MPIFAKLLILFFTLFATGVLWGLVFTAPSHADRAALVAVVVGAILSTQITLGTTLLVWKSR